MGKAAGDNATITASAHLPREILAWRIVLVAFGLFLVACAVTAYTVQWYVWRSQIDMLTQVEVARGTVRVQRAGSEVEEAIVEPEMVAPGDRISTDSTSQAVLSISNPQTGEVVTSVTLFNDTQVLLREAGSPRFAFEREEYTIEVEQELGRTELYVSRLPEESTLSIMTSHGALSVETEGHYLIDEFEDETVVTVREGQATADGDAMRMTVNQIIGEDVPNPLDGTVSLVANHQFEPSYGSAWDFYHIDLPQGWQRPVVFKGREAVLLDRSQGNFTALMNTHGETGLIQDLDVNVRRYDAVEIRASFLIEEQSLSTCGEQGSECPVMLRVSYIAMDGSTQEFIIGFYSYLDPQRGYPLACATCRTDHQRVNMGAWYTYESGNLMTNLPENLRPRTITQAQIYASGWAYKVYISELDIVVGQ